MKKNLNKKGLLTLLISAVVVGGVVGTVVLYNSQKEPSTSNQEEHQKQEGSQNKEETENNQEEVEKQEEVRRQQELKLAKEEAIKSLETIEGLQEYQDIPVVAEALIKGIDKINAVDAKENVEEVVTLVKEEISANIKVAVANELKTLKEEVIKSLETIEGLKEYQDVPEVAEALIKGIDKINAVDTKEKMTEVATLVKEEISANINVIVTNELNALKEEAIKSLETIESLQKYQDVPEVAEALIKGIDTIKSLETKKELEEVLVTVKASISEQINLFVTALNNAKEEAIKSLETIEGLQEYRNKPEVAEVLAGSIEKIKAVESKEAVIETLEVVKGEISSTIKSVIATELESIKYEALDAITEIPGYDKYNGESEVFRTTMAAINNIQIATSKEEVAEVLENAIKEITAIINKLEQNQN